MSKKLREKLLREYQAGYTGLAFFRPDASGIRGKGVNRKHYQLGDDDYPYGGADPSYGEPNMHGRDSGRGHGPSRQTAPVPKNVASDDERWEDGIDGEVDEMGGEGWSSGTPPQGNIVDDPPRARSKFGLDNDEEEFKSEGLTDLLGRLHEVEMEEALGVPFNVAKAGQGSGGMHTGGRVNPGTSGNWSARPKGGNWDNYVDDEELDQAANEYNYGLPFAGDVTVRGPKIPDEPNPEEDDLIQFSIPIDSDTEELDDVDGMMKRVSNPRFQKSPGLARKHSRMQPGMTWKEDYHRGLVEAFVSLSDTPQCQKHCSKGIGDVDLDFSKNAFNAARATARQKFDRVDEPELVRFLIQIEPNHFMKSLGEVGKDKLLDIYETWAESVLGSDGASMEKMAERITKAIGRSE